MEELGISGTHVQAQALVANATSSPSPVSHQIPLSSTTTAVATTFHPPYPVQQFWNNQTHKPVKTCPAYLMYGKNISTTQPAQFTWFGTTYLLKNF